MKKENKKNIPQSIYYDVMIICADYNLDIQKISTSKIRRFIRGLSEKRLRRYRGIGDVKARNILLWAGGALESQEKIRKVFRLFGKTIKITIY